jgi:transposase
MPVIPGTGKRFRGNVLSTITNRGRLAFMVFRESFTTRVLLRFLRRLLRHTRRPVFLILDRHPVHLAAGVQRWVARRADQLRLCFLPGYSPDLNPGEFLNHDVKSNALGRRRPHDAAELVSVVRSYLRSTQRQPAIIQRYFHAPSVQYAAL